MTTKESSEDFHLFSITQTADTPGRSYKTLNQNHGMGRHSLSNVAALVTYQQTIEDLILYALCGLLRLRARINTLFSADLTKLPCASE